MYSIILSTLLVSTVTYANDIQCPNAGQHFYPHPYYCSKFIECFDGVQHVQDCFEGTIFNPNVGFCDFPSNYECEDKLVPGPVGKCPPINGEFVDFLTHSTDCTIFYMCNWGVPIEMHCPNGLHFNSKLNVCDWPCYAGCTLEQKLYVTT